jgi:hypothetical protein
VSREDDTRSAVIAAWQAGNSLSHIAARTGLRERTVHKGVREWIDARLP